MKPVLPALPALLFSSLLACGCGSALAQVAASGCGSLDNGYGPFDYITDKDKLGVVEKFHFSPQVERLQSGQSSGNIGADLAYTLHAFPNHHRALFAMVRLGQRKKTLQLPGVTYSVECYFDRALRFRPNDTTARLLYANFLFDNKRAPEALRQTEQAAQDAGDNAFTHYNIGLIYMERQHYAEALAHAHKAYALGFTQPGLREQLQHLGHWKEAAVGE